MKRYLAVLLMVIFSLTLSGCMEIEQAPKETELPILNPISGSILESTHDIEGFKFVTTYDICDYDLARWRITDSKVINMTGQVKDIPDGVTVLIEHVHIDMSLKSTDPQLDGLSQDSMDDSYHGNLQDGFFIDNVYKYENKFAVEGFSKDLIDGWIFINGSYGSGNVTQRRLTERNLVKYGHVYANKMQVVYDVLIRYDGEEFYHVVSILDEFLIPVKVEEEITD